MTQDVLLAHARKYAERQPVIVTDADKQLLVPITEATQDPAQLDSWFAVYHPDGVGLRTDNLVVLDIAAGADAELRRCEEKIGVLPATREQSTPSGGRHLFFRRPESTAIEPTTLAPGVKVIAGPGAYVITAPSRNSRGAYGWVDGKVPIAPLPDAWARALSDSRASVHEHEPEPEEKAAPRERRREAVTLVATPVEGDLVSDINLTDVGNGIRIAVRHGHDLRYCFPFARWFTWDGRRWSDVDNGEPVRRAKENARWLAASALELPDDTHRKAVLRWALESEKDARIRAALAMAQSEPGIPVAPADLDQNPWLLNVENGTLDLRTGKLRAHDRDDLITKLAPVAFDPAAEAPLWERVLARVLPDPAVREYVQHLAGYALTGSTREQRITIWWGSGNNGKSTVINTLLTLLGEDYGQEAAPAVFLERRGDSIPNDIARLRGARLVIAVETAQNRKLNEALVKAMTGGDRLVARFMRSEFFEFVPSFTPVLVTNHLPVTTDTTHALWRRVDIVPFTETIAADEQDLDLAEKLRAELPGILNWALAGCAAWQKRGELVRPEAVLQATAVYRTDMDVVGRFLDECCTLTGDATTSATALFNHYQYWTQETGEEPLSAAYFGRRLIDRGFKSKRGSGGKRMWQGIEPIKGTTK